IHASVTSIRFPYTTLFRSQDIIDMLSGTKTDGALKLRCKSIIHQHDGCSSIRDQRTVCATQRRRHQRIFLGHRVAELHTKIFTRSEEHTSELQLRENLVCR